MLTKRSHLGIPPTQAGIVISRDQIHAALEGNGVIRPERIGCKVFNVGLNTRLEPLNGDRIALKDSGNERLIEVNGMVRVNRDRRDRCAGLGIARTTSPGDFWVIRQSGLAGSVHTDNLP